MLYLYETRMTRQVFQGSRQEFEKFICPLGSSSFEMALCFGQKSQFAEDGVPNRASRSLQP